MSTSPSFTAPKKINIFCTAMRKMVYCNIARELKLVFGFECQDVGVWFCKVLHISHVEFQISLIFDILANSNSWTSNYWSFEVLFFPVVTCEMNEGSTTSTGPPGVSNPIGVQTIEM